MKSQKIFGIRFRVRDGASGIELLPARGSPADLQQQGERKSH
jgi:hypothetical protein